MAGFGERFRSQAACRTSRLTPEDFVGPDRLERRYERESRIARAKRVCAGCPVRLECLEWAIQRKEVGVWGGTTEDERRLMVRKATGLYLHRQDPATLTPQQRLRLNREEAAWRLYREGMEPGEIAREIGVSLETVKSYLRSQRTRERDEMERAQELSGWLPDTHTGLGGPESHVDERRPLPGTFYPGSSRSAARDDSDKIVSR